MNIESRLAMIKQEARINSSAASSNEELSGQEEEDEDDNESLREASQSNFAVQKNEARQGMAQKMLGVTGVQDLAKTASVNGVIKLFLKMPESRQIQILLATVPETFGFSLIAWDAAWVWAILKSEERPKVGFTIVLLFVSLVFWIALGVCLFLLAMVTSFVIMGPADQATTIWNLGFDSISAISSLFR